MKDPEIREILRNTELSKYFSDPNSKVIEEFRLTPLEAQIDMAVLNGAFHAYEIKGASDTLQRLPNQINSYLKVFDYISVVTEKKYSQKIIATTPSQVGVILCENGRSSIIRKATRNNSVDPFYQVIQLRKEELIELLEANQIKFRKGDRKVILSRIAVLSISIENLSQQVREKLKSRK